MCDTSKSQAEHYHDILKEKDANGETCEERKTEMTAMSPKYGPPPSWNPLIAPASPGELRAEIDRLKAELTEAKIMQHGAGLRADNAERREDSLKAKLAANEKAYEVGKEVAISQQGQICKLTDELAAARERIEQLNNQIASFQIIGDKKDAALAKLRALCLRVACLGTSLSLEMREHLAAAGRGEGER
jgi:hypothetical protein